MHQRRTLLPLSSERSYGFQLPKRQRELSDKPSNTSVPSDKIPLHPKEPPEPNDPSETSEPSEPSEPLEPLETECVESKNPFQEPSEGLMIVDGYVNNAKANILFDSGAVLNHISLDFCKRHNIAVQPEDTHVGIMANNTEEKLSSTVSTVTISIGSYSETMRLVANQQNYDVILGKKWCNNHKAVLDCETNEIRFCQ